MMGKEATNLTGTWMTIKLFAFILIPKVCKILNLSLFSQKVGQFFSKLVKSNIESREKHRIVRPDMINLLMEARKNGLKHEESEPQQDAGFATVQESEIGKSTKTHKLELTDQDITSQALIFFFAGFETVSSLMCFMAPTS
jgi:cytochrome P450 family 9